MRRGGLRWKRPGATIYRWRTEIESGGGVMEKHNIINKWTLDRFYEARQQKLPVTTRMLQQWATQAAMQFEGENFSFSASHGCVTSHGDSNR